MGTDIHWFVEQFDEDEGKWYVIDGDFPRMEAYYSPLIYDARNYKVFAVLAGIRSDVPAKHPPRGLPEDCNPITRACADDDFEDYTAHTWFTLSELLALSIEDEIFRKTLDALQKTAHGDAHHVRVVMWFDR